MNMKLNNKYYIIRHGQALSNVKEIVSSWPEKIKNPLTKFGKETIKQSAKKLKDKNINLIFASPLLRTKQTSEILGKELRIKPKIDKRLKEIDFGIFNGGPIESMWKSFENEQERIKKASPKGESYTQVLERMTDFLKSIDKKYKGKNILIVSHEGPLMFLEGELKGFTLAETIKKFPAKNRIHKGEIRELN